MWKRKIKLLFSMNRFLKIIFCFLILFSYQLAKGSVLFQEETEDTLNGYEKLYEELINLEPDPTKYIPVKNFIFKKDAARFTLVEGDWFFCKPVQDRVCAAVFLGKGLFDLTLPTKIEKDQLYRFFEKDSLNEEFNFLFIMFGDHTYREFEKEFSFSEKNDTKEIKRYLEYALEYMGKKKEKAFNYEIVETLIDDEQNELFYSHFSDDKLQPLFFEINPFEVEEVSFMRRTKGESVTHTREVINQFHKYEDYKNGIDLQEEKNEPLDIVRYQMDCRIENNLDFYAETTVQFQSRKDDQHWIYFWLHRDLDVDSVFWENKKVPFFKGDEGSLLWIECPYTLDSDDTFEVRMFYQGDIIEREIDWVYLKSTTFWHPRQGLRDDAEFDIFFQTPVKYQFVCSGLQQFADTTDESVHSRWISTFPVRSAAFNIGVFKTYTLKSDKLPEINVFMAEAAHDFMHRSHRLVFSRNMEKDVAIDVARSMDFFNRVFGEYPMPEFYATEIPYSHGQAFPGLIHLSWLTFYRKWADEGYNQIFRAHEVAHQWWGIGVDFKTYHDQWLSEGFSQFAGLWYMQQKVEDEKRYYEILKDWSNEIFSNRKYLFGKGQEAGPIWLGYRTHSSTTEGDYDLIIYKKSAWVLHMLRMMLMDLDTKSDSTFINMMKDFYHTYLYQAASTKDFQKIVEKYFEQDMQWFFDQWIYNVDLPTYKYSYKVEEQSGGKFSLKVRVLQEEVPEQFRMFVPVKIEFNDGASQVERLLVEGKESNFEFLGLEHKPKKIIFNDMEGVLCKVDKEGWE